MVAFEKDSNTAEEQAHNVESGNVPQQNNLNRMNVMQKVNEKSRQPPKKRQKTKVVDIIKKKYPKNISEIWDHFTRLEGSNSPRAACNYCGTSYAAHPKLNGTTSLWAHLESSCKKYPYKLDKSQKTMHDYKSMSGNSIIKGKTLNVEEVREGLGKMTIIDGFLFRIVEGEWFKAFCQFLEPRFEVPSRHIVARDCMKIFLEEKKKLKRILKTQRVCLTTYTWTSLQNLNYMCLIAHWISNDWKLQKRIINFCIIENHKGKTIAKQIEECLIYWGINKILTITWKDVILNNDYMHIRCCAHIINLIVKEGLEKQNEVIMRVRNTVKYIRSSPVRLKAFKKCVEKEKINSKSLVCLDVETRWNSTYLMLEAAEKFEKTFDRLGDEDQKYIDNFDCYEMNQDEEYEGRKGKVKGNKIIGPPMGIDWINDRNFVKFLKIFYHVTLKFSGSSYITSNIFFRELTTVHMGLSTMINRGDRHMTSMAIRMKEKFNKYWGSIDNINWLLFVAVVLDPRYKLKYINFGFATIYEGDVFSVKRMTEKVEEMLILLYKNYEDSDFQHTSKNEHARQEYYYMHVDEEDDPSELLESQFVRHLEKEQCVESKSELERYLLDGCEKSTNDFDVLNWWKVNTPKYLILFKVTKDVLAIPISTITSESAFSTSGCMIDLFRSSLSPKMVEALICAQDWLRITSSPIDLYAMMKDVEQFEGLEKGKHFKFSFILSLCFQLFITF
ncbi:hypothetical protein Pfo_011396 [Paulownia fortunei]|nr:hypothetical protein Pfo_011396 [Paulownia fortunei]